MFAFMREIFVSLQEQNGLFRIDKWDHIETPLIFSGDFKRVSTNKALIYVNVNELLVSRFHNTL